MIEADALKKYIGDRWHGDPAVELCRLIIDFIVQSPADDSKMLTYVSLAKLTRNESINEDLYRAVGILSARFDALIMHFMMIDEDGKYHFLDDEEAGSILGVIGATHPMTGQFIKDNGANILPYYEGNRSYLLSLVE